MPVTLNSLYFLPFAAASVLCVFLVGAVFSAAHRKAAPAQRIALLVISYIFTALFDYRFCLILLAATLVTYFGALLTQRGAKWAFPASVVLLVAALGFFKYVNFFLESVEKFFIGGIGTLNIILPVGISFYVFTAIGYLADVKKKKYAAEKSFVKVALLLAYFPKIISGPIVRGDDFFPQLEDYCGIKYKNFQTGIQKFAVGLFKKIVLADHLGVFADDFFASPSAFNTGTALLAVFSYSLQIYFDFSGYTDMAIGISEILGIKLCPNFDLPYLAKNPSDFWSRWHISLSSWLRDYIYFPLGGSRKGSQRTYFNLMAVMLISGLWHGAGYTFILWGLLHGLYSCAFRIADRFSGSRLSGSDKSPVKAACILCNFIIVSFFWIFFRASSFSNALAVIKSCFTAHGGISQPYTWSFFAAAVLLAATVAAIAVSRRKKLKKTVSFYPLVDLGTLRGQVLFICFAAVTIIMGYFGHTAFIYGNF